MAQSTIPPLRALVKGAVWCGAIWGLGYGSYILTLGQMDKNLKTWKDDIDPMEKQRVRNQHEQFMEGVLGKEMYSQLRERAEREKTGK